jgi:hypothetical protein
MSVNDKRQNSFDAGANAMSNHKRNYDVAVARIAGDIAAGIVSRVSYHPDEYKSLPGVADAIASDAVFIARRIIQKLEEGKA